MGAAGNVIEQDTDVLRFTISFMNLKLEKTTEEQMKNFFIQCSQMGRKCLRSSRLWIFTLGETFGEQQDSVPGQGMLVDEDLRGWHPCIGVGQESRKPWNAAGGGIPSAA